MAFSTGSSNGPMAEINVTPLVDVMLVLLIIFIITAPLMSHKVQVALPEAELTQKDDEDKDVNKPSPITMAITEDGSLYWNDELVSREILQSRLATEAQRKPQPQLNIRADRTTKLRIINDVTKVAQEQGMMNVGFVATKEKRE